MTIYDAFGDRKRRDVMRETWGYPKENIKHHGWMIFTQAECGTLTELQSSFPTTTGPDFYTDMQDFIGNKAQKSGHVYRFDGYYIKFKNGGYRFTGKVRDITKSVLKA